MWMGKLAPPQMQLEAVPRKELFSRFLDYRHTSLILVTSPPGFGKTTLLGQWRASLLAQATPVPVAWLSLDEADSDPNRFLAYALLALERTGLELQALSQRAHAQALDANPLRTIASLLQSLERDGRRIVLILDDYHRAASPTIDEIVMTLMERGSSWLQFVVASRTRPHWPLSKLKARGLLHELDASDLVLSLSEAGHILGPDLDRAELSVVHSRTEGWAVAVQLARLWMARSAGSSHGLRAFSGRVAEVAEYLAEQIVESLPSECREFMLETSLLERFNVELANVVRGRGDSAALLEQLAPYEALLVPLDAGRTWFRYHLMLADFLRPRLDAGRAEQIHRQAAVWLAQQTDWVLAVSHALMAHDTKLAIDLIHQAGGWELVLRKGILYTRSLLEQFDDLSRRTEPQLLLMQAYLHAKLGEQSLSMELLRLATVAIRHVPQLKRDLEVTSALVNIYFDQIGEPDRWPTTGDAANARLPDDPLGQGTLLCAGAIAALADGRIGAVVSAAQTAQTRMKLAGSPLGENYCLIHWGVGLGLGGQFAAARQKIDEALALAEANFGTDSSLKALVGCFKAQHLYWQGQWDEASSSLTAGQETLETIDGWFDVFATTAEITWRIALRKQGIQPALAALDSTAHLARRRGLARLERLVNAWRCDLFAQCGLFSQAQQEAEASSLDRLLPMTPLAMSPTGVDWRFLEAGSLALARVQIGMGAAQAAQTRLDRAAAALDELKIALPTLRLRLMSLVAKRKARDGDVSAREVSAILEPLFQQSMAGLLLELGPPALPMLQMLENALPPQAITLMAQLRGWQTHPPRRKTLFSAKESAVLELLVAGQANKAIARSLDISENTVKFHLKQIFQKLQVDSRAAAIAAAIQQGFSVPPSVSR
jgi:LuxR family transcriptional regulator, maltose regulon positive regulatory protein